MRRFPSKSLLGFCLAFAGFLAFLLWFGDRVGWEGDDISQLEGIVDFKYRSTASLYQYFWQPLSYHVMRWLHVVVRQPAALFYVPQVIGALALTVLLAAMAQAASRRLDVPLLLAMLLLVPELFFVGLWYNSSVLSLLPTAIALLMIHLDDTPWLSENSRHLLVGFCAALAVLFRLEFVLCVPLFGYLVLRRTREPGRALALCTAAFGIVMATALATRLVDFHQIAAAAAGFDTSAREQAITGHGSTKIVLSAMNGFAWFALIGYGVWFVAASLHHRRWASLAVLLPAAVVCYPLTRFVLTPKHLLPALVFVPFVMVHAAIAVRDRIGRAPFRALSLAAVAAAILVQFVCVAPQRRFPFVEIGTRSKPVRTADGDRANGAYLRAYSRIRTRLGDRADGGYITLDRRLRQIIEQHSSNVVIVYENREGSWFDNPWSWPWLSFYLQCDGFRVREYDDMRRIVLERDGHLVEMRLVPNSVDDWRGDDPRATVIRMPFISRAMGHSYERVRLSELYDELRQRFHVERFADEPRSLAAR